MIKLSFHRNKKMQYILVMPEVYIDGQLVKILKNGETYVENVTEGEHEITIIAQIAKITRRINVQQNMCFNIDLHMNSFDVEIVNENGEKFVDEKNVNVTTEKNQAVQEKVTAKNDFSNKEYWKDVLKIAVSVAIVVGVVSIVSIIL